jgi:hypothetical protein
MRLTLRDRGSVTALYRLTLIVLEAVVYVCRDSPTSSSAPTVSLTYPFAFPVLLATSQAYVSTKVLAKHALSLHLP